LTSTTACTPNGLVASIVLEELGIDYETVALKIQTNVQKEEWFLKIKCVHDLAEDLLIPSQCMSLSETR
jgi:hypothetical protein